MRFRAWLVAKPTYELASWIIASGFVVMLSPLAKYLSETAYMVAYCTSAACMVLGYGAMGLQAYWERRR